MLRSRWCHFDPRLWKKLETKYICTCILLSFFLFRLKFCMPTFLLKNFWHTQQFRLQDNDRWCNEWDVCYHLAVVSCKYVILYEIAARVNFMLLSNIREVKQMYMHVYRTLCGYMHTYENHMSILYLVKQVARVRATAPIAESLEGHAGKQGVAGSIPGGGILYHFEFFAYIPLITARRQPYKSNQAWHLSRVMGGQR